MAKNNSNTLNDTKYTDKNVTLAKKTEQGKLPQPGPEYDQVLSTFVKVMKDEVAAKTFTEALYRVAAETNTYVLTLLDSLDISTTMTLNASMAYYLNAINSPATMYGVQQPVIPNYYAGRNVLG